MEITNDSTNSIGSPQTILPALEWRDRAARHADRLNPLIRPHLDRSSRGMKHPVMDFLFQYYPFAPAHLMRWSPGWGVLLEGEPTADLLQLKDGRVTPDGWMLDPARLPFQRRPAIDWVVRLLSAVSERSPRFGCFGLHEWAMVYRTADVRHQQLPLRYSPARIAEIVESMTIVCSHYDAFRFFTPPARPLNRLQPECETRLENEQRGCLHANMDLYKWSQQFYPWIDSDLIADCFLLAMEIREVDMRASPYDVSSLGYAPIAIETDTGRLEYVNFQSMFADKAVPIRSRLIGALRKLLDAVS